MQKPGKKPHASSAFDRWKDSQNLQEIITVLFEHMLTAGGIQKNHSTFAIWFIW